LIRFNIEGNTLLKSDEIDAAVLKPFTGKQREYGDVRRADRDPQAALSLRRFQRVMGGRTEQDLDRGVVTLRVIEARIGRVAIEGKPLL